MYRYTDNGGKEKAAGHPLYFLLHDEPNPEMTSFVFRETLMTHLLLWGNAYAQIIRNGRGEVIGLYPLMPDRMAVDRDSKGQLYYEYTVSIAAGAKSIAFGDFSYYWIADRQGRSFKRLNELFAATGQVGFLASQRVDGRLILAEAVKVLSQKAAA